MDPRPTLETTRTGLLGGRVTCVQPSSGYRAAIDAVLLAASVPAAAGEHVLDIGTGVGSAALCLASRVDGLTLSGMDLQPQLIKLATQGAALSQLAGCVNFETGDLLSPPKGITRHKYDHVMANPPYVEAGTGTVPDDQIKRISTIEGKAKFADWVKMAANTLKTKGTVTFIHRADRLDGLLADLTRRFGGICVYPLWPKAGEPARRIILQATLGSAAPVAILPGLVLHSPDGSYTPQTQQILTGASFEI